MFIRIIFLCTFIGISIHTASAQDFSFEERKKSPLAAFTISAASTAIPFYIGMNTIYSNNDLLGAGIITAALVVGPSLGYLYSEDSESFRSGMLNRSLAMAPIAYGSFIYFHNERYINKHGEEFYTEEEVNEASIAILIGAAYLSYNVISDWFGAARSAKSFNKGFSMKLSPGYHFESGTPTLNMRINF